MQEAALKREFTASPRKSEPQSRLFDGIHPPDRRELRKIPIIRRNYALMLHCERGEVRVAYEISRGGCCMALLREVTGVVRRRV